MKKIFMIKIFLTKYRFILTKWKYILISWKKRWYNENIFYWIQICFDWMKIYFDIMKKGDIMKICFIKNKIISYHMNFYFCNISVTIVIAQMFCNDPANIYFSKSTKETLEANVVLMSLVLALNIIHTIFYWFYCWPWIVY